MKCPVFRVSGIHGCPEFQAYSPFMLSNMVLQTPQGRNRLVDCVRVAVPVRLRRTVLVFTGNPPGPGTAGVLFVAGLGEPAAAGRVRRVPAAARHAARGAPGLLGGVVPLLRAVRRAAVRGRLVPLPVGRVPFCRDPAHPHPAGRRRLPSPTPGCRWSFNVSWTRSTTPTCPRSTGRPASLPSSWLTS